MTNPRVSSIGRRALKILLRFGLVVIVVVSVTVALNLIPLSEGVAISRITLVLCVGVLCWLVMQAVGLKRAVFGALSILAVAAALWTYNTAIWRDAEYRRVTDTFKHATVSPKQADIGDGRSGWNESTAIAGGILANIRASDHLDIATVRYSDETSQRDVFPSADYINISDVRVRASVLYVLRSITLLNVEYRLAVYDLNRRAVVTDRRVDLRDVK